MINVIAPQSKLEKKTAIQGMLITEYIKACAFSGSMHKVKYMAVITAL